MPFPRSLHAAASRTLAGVTLTALASVAAAANVTVSVTDSSGKPLADAVVYLEPTGAALPTRPLANVQIVQAKRQFSPQVSVVTVGTPVSFPNLDTVRHHVYSFSPAKTFDLKLYAGTPPAPVVFDKPGIAVLGCNIHDAMAAWVVVVDTPLFARTGADGKAAVADVPAGTYRLRTWHATLPVETAPLSTALAVGSTDPEPRVRLAVGPAAR